jgi:hypothetical protein
MSGMATPGVETIRMSHLQIMPPDLAPGVARVLAN